MKLDRGAPLPAPHQGRPGGRGGAAQRCAASDTPHRGHPRDWGRGAAAWQCRGDAGATPRQTPADRLTSDSRRAGRGGAGREGRMARRGEIAAGRQSGSAAAAGAAGAALAGTSIRAAARPGSSSSSRLGSRLERRSAQPRPWCSPPPRVQESQSRNFSRNYPRFFSESFPLSGQFFPLFFGKFSLQKKLAKFDGNFS